MCYAPAGLGERKAVDTISWTELARHASPEDLWVAVNGRAYDLTAYQTQHPGGGLILQHHAGRDASEAWLAYAHNAVPGMRELMRGQCVGVMETPSERPLSRSAVQLKRVRAAMERDGLFVPNLWNYAWLAGGLTALFAVCLALVHRRCWCTGGLLMSLFWQQARSPALPACFRVEQQRMQCAGSPAAWPAQLPMNRDAGRWRVRETPRRAGRARARPSRQRATHACGAGPRAP